MCQPSSDGMHDICDITTVLWPSFHDHPGEPVPEENFWTLWCNGRLTEADTPTIRLGAIPSRLTSAHLHHPHCLQAGCPSCRPTNSVKALKACNDTCNKVTFLLHILCKQQHQTDVYNKELTTNNVPKKHQQQRTCLVNTIQPTVGIRPVLMTKTDRVFCQASQINDDHAALLPYHLTMNMSTAQQITLID